MLDKLSYSVSFPTNGLNLSGDYSFQPGLTAVTGQNGTGKTFMASEMVRYMLFGKRALRRPASDYKTLVGSLRVRIGDEWLTIERNRKESVTDDSGKVLAVGAEAVNELIIEKLGFNLDVFDVICSAKQKDSERLTSSRPAERKKMIDDIVGLSANEDVEKFCRTEARGLKRDADTIRENIVKAMEPVKPDDYAPSAELRLKVIEAQNINLKRAELERNIAGVGAEPIAPSRPRPTDLDELRQHEATRKSVEQAAAKLDQMIASILAAAYTAKQLDAAEAWVDYHDEVDRRGPRPTRTAEEVTELLLQWNRHHTLRDQPRHAATCPECSHEFLTGAPVPPAPDVPFQELENEQRAHIAWATPLAAPEGEPSLNRVQIRKEREALTRAELRQTYVEERDAVVMPQNRAGDLAIAESTGLLWIAYDRQHEAWETDKLLAAAATRELATLPPAQDLGAITDRFTAASIYESQLAAYVAAKVIEDEQTQKVADKVAKAESYTAGADALKRSRAQFKAFLAPSLGKIASSLIAQMTNGKYDHVIVDEEMNIEVNGQDVAALSGANATSANLALRLALGRVLTSKVFPVFIGDEIDADADEERADATAQAITNLRGQLDQIFLISHKPLPFADHHIKMGESTELQPA